jgi:hypothetical protein
MTLSAHEFDLIGSPGSPATLTPGASTSGVTLNMTFYAGTFSAVLAGQVATTAVPSAGTTIQWFYSLNGSDNIYDQSIQVIPPINGTSWVGPWRPPIEAQYAGCLVQNNDAGSVNVSVWIQGALTASTNL